MNAIKNNIPNFITCLNLLFGCIAIVLVFEGRLAEASWMIAFAAIADFFDGFAARLLHVNSPIGKELDSLGDVVSFGVAPGMIMYSLIQAYPYSWIALLIPVFAALRLAKFNIDTRQTTSFIGLPTPANALFIASFPLILEHSLYWHSIYTTDISLSVWSLIVITLLCCALMVSPLKLFSLKMKDTTWSNNKIKYLFVIVSITCFVILNFTAVPLIMLFYIVFSVMDNKGKEYETTQQ